MRKVGLVVTCTLILSACPRGYQASHPLTVDPPTLQEGSTLFELQSDGSYQFQTNDRKYITPFGTTLWLSLGPAARGLYDRSIEVVKSDGDPQAGFGMVFSLGHGGTKGEGGGQHRGFSLLAVMLNNNSQYCIGQAIGARWSFIQKWTDSITITRGINQKNKLRVKEVQANNYELYVNGSLLTTFTDSRDDEQTGTDIGYLVVIEPKEDFPNKYVRATFKEVATAQP